MITAKALRWVEFGKDFWRSLDGGRFDTWYSPAVRSWVCADWDVCKVPKGVVPTDTMRNLLKQCRAVDVAYIPMCPVWEERNKFGVCADAIQDAGHDEWAELVRSFPVCFRSYAMWKTEADEWEETWQHFDMIRWVFAPGWRKRYKDVPRLGNVSH